jgi:hypothetical protein
MPKAAHGKLCIRKFVHMVKHIKIRRGVWETNSSSSHSLSIADDSKPFIMDRSLLPNQHGRINLHGGEFGWEWKKYNDARTKANYLAVGCSHDPIKRDMLVKCIQQQTGCTEVDFSFTKYGLDSDSYIDHQSTDVPYKAFESDETLRNFIFNMNSWLFTGNDNSEPANDFHDVPVYEENRVVMPEYKYELTIEGIDGRSIKFKKKPTKEQIESAILKIACDLDYVAFNGREGGHFDTDNGIYGKIMRSGRNDVFQLGYSVEGIDFKNCTFPIKNSRLNVEAHRLYERDFKSDIPWDKGGWNKVRELERELLDSGNLQYVRRIKYIINKV